MKTKKTLDKQVDQVEVYEKPAVEIIEMEIESILCSSAPDMPGDDW